MARLIDALLWTLAVLWLVAAVALSLFPLPEAIRDADLSDKLAHGALYAGLAWSWLFAAVWRPGRQSRAPALGPWVVAAAICLGILLELGQGLVTRSPDPWDAVADAIGVGIAFATWSLLRRRIGAALLRTDDVRTGA